MLVSRLDRDLSEDYDPAAAMRERFVDVCGTEIFVREWGRARAPALLYWDGLGGSGLHANEIAPVLASRYGLHVIAPDAPGHGRSPALRLETYRPSVLAVLAAELLSALTVRRAAFVGFSWGARIACSFGASSPLRTTCLVLIDGGYLEWADIPGVDATADLETCVADARRDAENDAFPSWEAYFASERTSLGRWTPALEEAHRAMRKEAGGRVVPILSPEVSGAIRYGGYQEPVAGTYPSLAAARAPILLLSAPESAEYQAAADAAIDRFRAALPQAVVRSLPGAHDLVSHAGPGLAEIVGEWLAGAAGV